MVLFQTDNPTSTGKNDIAINARDGQIVVTSADGETVMVFGRPVESWPLQAASTS